ncbi:putative mitochondrial protein [Andalucia godoyi]|uniref:Putative mitochondrial protein n=1 Tax=Andalucia godoyi TaxID=505711 RepID=A0A8K0AHD0_ANDGO|nr:putative mitochondrial protein [Andalucia godoyi]|eukprot:ANDGO_06777.mRNA.1 putative mitochondrial protein
MRFRVISHSSFLHARECQPSAFPSMPAPVVPRLIRKTNKNVPQYAVLAQQQHEIQLSRQVQQQYTQFTSDDSNPLALDPTSLLKKSASSADLIVDPSASASASSLHQQQLFMEESKIEDVSSTGFHTNGIASANGVESVRFDFSESTLSLAEQLKSARDLSWRFVLPSTGFCLFENPFLKPREYFGEHKLNLDEMLEIMIWMNRIGALPMPQETGIEVATFIAEWICTHLANARADTGARASLASRMNLESKKVHTIISHGRHLVKHCTSESQARIILLEEWLVSHPHVLLFRKAGQPAVVDEETKGVFKSRQEHARKRALDREEEREKWVQDRLSKKPKSEISLGKRLDGVSEVVPTDEDLLPLFPLTDGVARDFVEWRHWSELPFQSLFSVPFQDSTAPDPTLPYSYSLPFSAPIHQCGDMSVRDTESLPEDLQPFLQSVYRKKRAQDEALFKRRETRRRRRAVDRGAIVSTDPEDQAVLDDSDDGKAVDPRLPFRVVLPNM